MRDFNPKADEVTKRVVEIEALLVARAAPAGIPYADTFEADTGNRGQGDNVTIVRIELARRSDRWGLWAYVGGGEDIDPVPLRDAPLFLRESFLMDSVDFVSGFLELVKNHPQRQEDALSEAVDAIAALREFDT